MPRTVRIGSRSRPFDSFFRRRPTWTSTVRSSISASVPKCRLGVARARTPGRASQTDIRADGVHGAEINVARAAPQPAGFVIEVEVAGIEAIGDAFRTGAAQQRANPRHQLGNRERLDHVIVRADRRPRTRSASSPLGQHDDWKRAGVLARSRASAYFEPGHAGQHPIENDEVGRVLGEAQLRLVAPLHRFPDDRTPLTSRL